MPLLDNGTILINEWSEGIGQSSNTGFADIVNCEIHNPKGTLKIALAPTKISSTTVDKVCTWLTRATTVEGEFYASGDLNVASTDVYKISNTDVVSAITAGPTNPVGGLIWKDYLIVCDLNLSTNVLNLDAFGPLSSSPTWTASFASTTFNLTLQAPKYLAPMFTHPSDSVLYIGAGGDVASLEEVAGSTFDPSTGGTFTFTASALDLPEDYITESLSQLGENLVIGASIVNGDSVNHKLFNGLIFPWDRISASFGLPTGLDTGGVKPVKNVNNNLFVVNGERGNMYLSNLSLVQRYENLAPLASQDNVGLFLPNAIEVIDGEILVGVSTDSTELFNPCGVYGFKDGAWRRMTISTGEDGSNDALYIGAILAKNDREFFVAWGDDQNSSFGIDVFGKSSYRYTGYKAFVETQNYRVGNARNGRNYQYVDVQLAKDLTTGQGIKISYRTSQDDSYTLIKTIDFATHGAINKISVPAKMVSAEAHTIQFKIELTTGSSSTSTPELLSVIIS